MIIKNSIEAKNKIQELVSNGALTVNQKNKKDLQDISFKQSSKNGKITYPTETDRGTIQALLGKSYLVKDTEGNLLPNYNVFLENFPEPDNSLDLKQFTDYRTGTRNQKFVFQTDSIVSSKGNETNDGNSSSGKNFRNKKLRNVEFVINIERGTQSTQVNVRDTSGVVAFDLLASDLEQHQRMNLLIDNRFIAKLWLNNSVLKPLGVSFNLNAPEREEYIKVGEKLYNIFKTQIVKYKEKMTIQRPGGFQKSDLVIIASPLAIRAMVDYQSNLPASDKAFVVAAEGELWNASIEGIKVYESNLFVGGQKLEVEDSEGETQVEYENDSNIEAIIIVKNYTKYAKANEFVNSGPITVNSQPVPHLIGQYTENQHNGAVIIPNLFLGITFDRVEGATGTIGDITTTDETAASANDGTASFEATIEGEDGNVQILNSAETQISTTPLIDGTPSAINETGLSPDNYTVNILDSSENIVISQVFTINAFSANKNKESKPFEFKPRQIEIATKLLEKETIGDEDKKKIKNLKKYLEKNYTKLNDEQKILVDDFVEKMKSKINE